MPSIFFGRFRAVAILLLIAATVSTVPAIQAQTFALLHEFSGPDGFEPQGTLTMDRAGNLYGATTMGGAGYGTVFKLSHKGTGWIIDTLYKFSGGADGASPVGPVTFGPDGTLYGTTSGGGANADGTVFNLRPPPTVCRSVVCPWTETVIHSFSGSDGRDPQYVTLIFDSGGNIYGTAAGGMSCRLGQGCGVVFKLSKSNNVWSETVLYYFSGGDDGALPLGGVTFDSVGNLYGTTWEAGAGDAGTVYELSNTGSGWTETTLQALSGSGTSGGYPYDAPVFDQQGNLYGTTSVGGSLNGGTVFQLQPSGNGWSFNVIYSFGLGKPFDSPTFDSAGNLYATTSQGGVNGTGNIFKLTRGTSGWTYADLFDFSSDFSNGYAPTAGLVLDSAGNIYGATALGGNLNGCLDGGCGVLFELTP